MKTFYEDWAQKEISGDHRLREQTLRWKAKVFTKLIPEDPRFRTLLDVGCAEGVLTDELSKLLKIDFSVGIEISTNFIRLGKERGKNTQFVQNDGVLPFKDKSFDLVICSDFIEHVSDISKYLNEIRRVSKFILFKIPIESCFIGNFLRAMGIYPRCGEDHPSGHLHLFSKKLAQEVIEKHGFSVINLSFEITPLTILYHNVSKFRILLNPFTYLGLFSRLTFPRWYIPLMGGNLFAYVGTER